MSLLDEYMHECVLMTVTRRKSPSGGYYETYEESDTKFLAAVEISNSTAVQIAQKDDFTSVYEVHLKKPMRLPFGSIFKRYADTDGITEKMFRVTSLDDEKTPVSSPLDLRVVRAEEFVPTKAESEDDNV